MRAEDVKQAAGGHWIDVLARLAPALEPALERPGRHVPCPVHGGKDGFRVFRDVADTGGGICNTCGAFADGFALLQWIRGDSFREILDGVAAELGLGHDHQRAKPAAEPVAQQPASQGSHQREDDDKLRERLRRYWSEALPLSQERAEPGRLFLARRNLSLRDLDDLPLRFHPNLPYKEKDWKQCAYYGAILAPFFDTTDHPVTLHRTWIDEEGNKAPVPAARKTCPYPRDDGRRMTGGAVRLGSAPKVLGIAEGIETALAIRTALGLVTWATLSSTLLERFEPPAGVERVIVWGDNDAGGAGQEAASNLKARLWKERAIQVAGYLPSVPGWDWNDLLRIYGRDGIPRVEGIGGPAQQEVAS